ncbi:MAG: PIN domain-containing protein [Candidatus Acidoferrales bacterium]
MKLFVDTWGWLILEDRKDPRHELAAECYRRRSRGQIVTSNFVLDETFTLLFRRRPFSEVWRFTQGLLQSSTEKFLRVEPVTETRFREAVVLRRRFSDKPRISFTDLTSMVIMRELGLVDILTADTHFQQVGLGFRLLPKS